MASSMDSSQKRIKTSSCRGLGPSSDSIVSYDHIHNDILEYLFSFLPVKDVAKLAILSKRFQKSWMLSRKLCFGDKYASRNLLDDKTSVVTHVLEHHIGQKIGTLQLRFDIYFDLVLVQKFIKIAFDKGLEELDLDYFGPFPFQLSTDFFDFESIKILKIDRCLFEFPAKLKGLSYLNTLVIRRMEITTEFLDNLFRHCFFLETLDLAHFHGIYWLKISTQNQKCFKTLKIGDCPNISRIEIDSPTLRAFHYFGCICFFKIHHVMQLEDVMINIAPSKSYMCPTILRNLTYDLIHVQVLTMSSVFLEALSRRIIDGKFQEMPYYFKNLKQVKLYMEGATFCNVYDVVAFLLHCPSLEKIFIDFNWFAFDEVRHYFKYHQAEDFQQLSPSFVLLKVIKLTGYKFEKYELELAKIFLQRAVNLEEFTLVTTRAIDTKVPISTMLVYYRYLQHWQASQKSRINLFHFTNDGHLDPLHEKIWHY